MKCSDCGVNEAISDDRCLECIGNERHAENAGYIPMSEIQRVIADLQKKADEAYERWKISPYLQESLAARDVYDDSIRQLKELIPSENDSSRVSGNDKKTECQQNAEQKDSG
jgi:hypothetical protein